MRVRCASCNNEAISKRRFLSKIKQLEVLSFFINQREAGKLEVFLKFGFGGGDDWTHFNLEKEGFFV